MVVEHQRQAIGHVPHQIEAQRLVLCYRRVASRAHGEVTTAAVVLGIGRRRSVGVITVPNRLLSAKVVPGRVVGEGSLQLHFGIGVVNRCGYALGRRPLHRKLTVSPHAIPFSKLVARILGYRVALVGIGGSVLLCRQVIRDTAPLGGSGAAPAVVDVTCKTAPAAY